VIQNLRDLGLTSYEAKTYVALAGLGPSEPKKVAGDARIPYPSAYSALKALASKGWVEEVVHKPVTYRAKKPSSIKGAVASRIEDVFGALQEVYKAEPTEETELVYTIRGSEKVLAKVYELIRGAKHSLVFVAPSMGLEDGKLLELLGKATERGIRLRAIGDEEAVGLMPPGAEIRTGNLVAVDLLVDDKTALIALPDYSACGWIDSPAVASHFKQFLELMWSTSTPA
jgi:HTH-type transcriptional regulator, sugar sensing transcriptional regulator